MLVVKLYSKHSHVAREYFLGIFSFYRRSRQDVQTRFPRRFHFHETRGFLSPSLFFFYHRRPYENSAEISSVEFFIAVWRSRGNRLEPRRSNVAGSFRNYGNFVYLDSFRTMLVTAFNIHINFAHDIICTRNLAAALVLQTGHKLLFVDCVYATAQRRNVSKLSQK